MTTVNEIFYQDNVKEDYITGLTDKISSKNRIIESYTALAEILGVRL